MLLLRFVFLILLYVYHTKIGVSLLLFRLVFVIKISEYKFGDLLFLSRFLLPFHTHLHPRPKFVQRNTQIQPCCSSLMDLQIYLKVPSIFILGLMVFNATFNNISDISWRSVLLVEETGGPGENHRPVASH